MAGAIDGVVQSAGHKELKPVRRPKRVDYIAALKRSAKWCRPWEVKLLLPTDMQAQVRLENLTGILRAMADDGQIARQFPVGSRYPEYRAL